jgi:spore maturation protein CgeB
MQKTATWQNIKILYIGSLNPQSNSFRRYRTLQELGIQMDAVDIDADIYGNVFSSLHHRLNMGPGVSKLNKKITKKIEAFKPQLIWVDKPFITAKTIRQSKKQMPGLRWINLITDDFNGKYKRAWRLLRATASLYDMHFVQRIENVEELNAYGANKVLLCFRSYDPAFHRPITLSDTDKNKYGTRVGFIGTWEKEREEAVAFLIKNKIEVSITGDGWPKGEHWNLIQPFYQGPSVYGEEYIKRLNGMEIALHFLRHANRDGQDSRTFEIPACKVFMLAERSELHQQFFEEDTEAVFFSTNNELLEKVKYYRDDKEARIKIAEAGYARVIKSGYSHKERLTQVLQQIFYSD